MKLTKLLIPLAALTLCQSVFGANLLQTTTSTLTLSCSTVTGLGANATVTVKPVTALIGSATLAVTLNAPPTGGVVVTPTSGTLNASNSASGIVFNVNLAAGCVGVTTAAPTFRFAAGGTPDLTITVNTTLTATTSGLSASPTSVALTCVKSGGVWTPGPSQTVNVTSAAVGGTPFTVDNSGVPPPAWATVTPLTGGTAGASPTSFTVSPAAGCGGFAVGTTNTATLHLLNAPAPDKLIVVTLQVLNPSPLTATPNPASLTYTKGSGTAGKVDVNVTSLSSPAPFFAVDSTSLPIWLTVDASTGTVPKSLRFTSTTVADTLAPGTYTATVRLKVSGYGSLALPISLLVTNPAPRLTLAEGTTRNINWTVGNALPTPFITAVSSDSPIPYSIVTGGTLAPVISAAQQKGLAYGFGTPIAVTFNPLIFAAAQPGNVLTGTVTFTWGNPASTIVVTFNITVQSPGATLTGLSPASLPTATSGQTATTFTVVLTGTGFVPSSDPTQKTRVGIVVGGSIVADTNIAANVVNASNIILTITVPVVADPYLPFSPGGSGGTVALGICNPVAGTCSTPTGTATLAIGSNPIIQGVTSASSYLQVTPPTLQTLAPYDMASVFGINFCSSGGTGCSSSQVLYGTPDPVTLRYPTMLSPDTAGPTQRQLSVTFQTHATPPVVIAQAPLLFATNGQINLMVPSAVSAQIGSTIDLVVNFGYGSGATLKSSVPFSVTVIAANPGVFTVGADGQGEGAILGYNWAVIGAGNPGGMRSVAADSDTVQIYMTGLGLPDGAADNASTGASTWATDCVTEASFLTSLNALTTGSLLNLDGTVVQSAALNTGRLIPCNSTAPTVTVGGVAGVVTYAGWVPDSIAGLYQVNVTLPGRGAGPFTTPSGASISSITTPVQLPVVVTSASHSSQTGVTVWVAPRLKVAPPTGSGLAGTVGLPWSGSNNLVVATEGSSPYRYAVTSGLLPSGLTLNAATGAISGTPAANTAGSYIVTVTATDSANVPVTGTSTFTLTVAGGLVLSSSGGAPYSGTFGTANASLTTVLATGGTYPYAYAITSPVSLPTGMTINAVTGVVGITALTPAGTYHVTVQATDSTSGTPLTGSLTFDIVVALQMSSTNPVAQTHGTPGTLTTVTATGATGTIVYTLDAASLTLGFTINSSTGAVGSGTAIASTPTVVVTATDGTAAPGAATAGVGTISIPVTVN